jgi:quinolinate synthase
MITAEELREKKSNMPGVVVCCYGNSTAEVKAESDICCTSANAVQVVRSFDRGQKILMTPDKNLAQYTKKRTNMDISYTEGYCYVHHNLTVGQVRKVKQDHPRAIFLAHPECTPGVLELADTVQSTSGMIEYVGQSKESEFIIGTETGILYSLSKRYPGKSFIPADPNMVCSDMKKTGLGDIQRALELMEPVVVVSEEIRIRAHRAIDRMMAIPRD